MASLVIPAILFPSSKASQIKYSHFRYPLDQCPLYTCFYPSLYNIAAAHTNYIFVGCAGSLLLDVQIVKIYYRDHRNLLLTLRPKEYR